MRDLKNEMHVAFQNGDVERFNIFYKKVLAIKKPDITIKKLQLELKKIKGWLDFAAKQAQAELLKTLSTDPNLFCAYNIFKINGVEIPENRVPQACFEAATNGNYEMVISLLTQGANFDILDERGLSPLFYAARNGHIKVVQTFIKHCLRISWANIDLPADEILYLKFVMFLAKYNEGISLHFSRLLLYHLRLDDKPSPYHLEKRLFDLAVAQRHFEVLKTLDSVSLNGKLLGVFYKLSQLVQQNNQAAAFRLINMFNDICPPPPYDYIEEYNLLNQFATLRWFDSFEKLLHMGRDFNDLRNYVPHENLTLLQRAVFNNHIALVENLLRMRDMDVKLSPDNIIQSFDIAVERNNTEILALLFTHASNFLQPEDVKTLFYAAVKGGDPQTVNILLNALKSHGKSMPKYIGRAFDLALEQTHIPLMIDLLERNVRDSQIKISPKIALKLLHLIENAQPLTVEHITLLATLTEKKPDLYKFCSKKSKAALLKKFLAFQKSLENDPEHELDVEVYSIENVSFQPAAIAAEASLESADNSGSQSEKSQSPHYTTAENLAFIIESLQPNRSRFNQGYQSVV